MALQLVTPSEEILDIARTGLLHLIHQRDTHTYAVTHSTEPKNLSLGLPLQLYSVTADQVLDGKPTERATFTGWRYLLLHADRVLMFVEVGVSRDGSSYEFSHASHGPFMHAVITSITHASQLVALQDYDFEVRLLEIPSLLTEILWFRSEKIQLFMPISPTREHLHPYQLYTERQLVTILRHPAVRKLSVKDRRA